MCECVEKAHALNKTSCSVFFHEIRRGRIRSDGRHRAEMGAFTLVEMIIVLSVAAIAAALVVPSLGQTAGSRVHEAARLMAADMAFARSASIAHADQPRVVALAPDADGYYIATSHDPNQPIERSTGKPYRVTFGQGRARTLAEVKIHEAKLGGDRKLQFGKYGQTDQAEAATITLLCQDQTATVRVPPSTGTPTVE